MGRKLMFCHSCHSIAKARSTTYMLYISKLPGRVGPYTSECGYSTVLLVLAPLLSDVHRHIIAIGSMSGKLYLSGLVTIILCMCTSCDYHVNIMWLSCDYHVAFM